MANSSPHEPIVSSRSSAQANSRGGHPPAVEARDNNRAQSNCSQPAPGERAPINQFAPVFFARRRRRLRRLSRNLHSNECWATLRNCSPASCVRDANCYPCRSLASFAIFCFDLVPLVRVLKLLKTRAPLELRALESQRLRAEINISTSWARA